MLINLRNALMGGKRLPYDAEVEYLESDGNQWFDVEIPYGSNTGIYADFIMLEASGFLFGATRMGSDNTTDLKLMIAGGGKLRFDRYDRSTRTFGPNLSQRQNFTFNPKGNASSTPYRYYSSVSGRISQYDTWYSTPYQSSRGLFGLFHAVINTSPYFSDTPSKMRLYGFELREYTSATAYTTTLKLTPVSVGGVGAMLDEITGETHFNMGTGDFGIGPDIPSPV